MDTHDVRRADPPRGSWLASLEQQVHDRIAAATAARREPHHAPRRRSEPGSGRTR